MKNGTQARKHRRAARRAANAYSRAGFRLARRAASIALLAVLLLVTLAVPHASAQTAPASGATPAAAATPAPKPSATPAPAPLSQPAITGPLQTAAPIVIKTGLPESINVGGSDFSHVSIDGVFSGIGIVQTNTTTTDRTDRMDVSNAQLILQQPTGLFQFYIQGGAYDIPALGTPLVPAGTAISDLYGPLPVAFVKIAPAGSSFSLMAGNLPTLIGAEYTFTFENVNIERGLLWNQENAINRGVQLNYNQGPIAAAVSWNNGFYSRSYTWLWGSLAYSFNSANTLSAVGGQNLGTDAHASFVAPLFQNNSGIYNLIYTYNASPWIVQPYFQWTWVPHNTSIGVDKATSTLGGAILASYALTHWFALAGRAEFIQSTGNRSDGSVNLLYGPGSSAWSLTATPTFQWERLFARLEFSFVRVAGFTAGDGFGSAGNSRSQFRALTEFGILF